MRPHVTVNWTLFGEILGAMGGIFTLTAVLIPHPITRWVHHQWTRFHHNRGRLRRIEDILDRLDHEVHPNGGGSLIDKVNHIVTELNKVRIDAKAMRDDLAISSAIVNVLMEREPGMLWRSNLQGEQVWASHALIEASGFSADELKGWGWMNTLAAEEQGPVRGAWVQAILDRAPFHRACHFVRKDGLVVAARMSAFPVKDATGDVAFYFGEVFYPLTVNGAS